LYHIDAIQASVVKNMTKFCRASSQQPSAQANKQPTSPGFGVRFGRLFQRWPLAAAGAMSQQWRNGAMSQQCLSAGAMAQWSCVSALVSVYVYGRCLSCLREALALAMCIEIAADKYRLLAIPGQLQDICAFQVLSLLSMLSL
jgi:hypothetical protein